MTLAHVFDDHVIRSEVRAEGFASWRLQARRDDGTWDRYFWVRITASDGSIHVSGNFKPTTFEGDSGGPLSEVARLGTIAIGSLEVRRRAVRGSGFETAVELTVEAACEDLRRMIADNKDKIRACVTRDGAEVSEETLTSAKENEALLEGLSVASYSDTYSEQPYAAAGVVAMIEAILSHSDLNDAGVESEQLAVIGEQTARRVTIAHLAVRRLHVLLSERATALAKAGA